MKYFFITLIGILMMSCKYECDFTELENGTKITSYEQVIRDQIQRQFKNTSLSLSDTVKAQLLYIDQFNTKKTYPEEFLSKNNELVNSLCTHIAEMNVTGAESKAEEIYDQFVNQLVNLNKGNQSCELPTNLYKPAIDDKKKAVISVGANSFDGFVIATNRNKAWSNVEQYYGESLGLELGINYALYKLEQTMEKIMSEQSVNPSDILVVLSSGLVEINDDVSKIRKGLEDRGFKVRGLSCEEEASYAYAANILKDYEDDSFFLDIGSGNTKIAWKNQANEIETYCGEGSLFEQRLVTHEKAFSSFDNLDIPTGRTKYCFVTGGGPFKLAEIKGHDISKNKFFCMPELSDFENENLEYGQMHASYEFLKLIKEKTNCEQIIFISHSNYAIGTLLELDY